MRIRKCIALFIVVVLSVASIIGCSSNSEETEAIKRTDLNIALDVSVQSLEPTNLSGVGSVVLFKSIYDTLIDIDNDMNIVPGLAESWTVSDNGLEYIFKLREGIVFSNGEQLTADDVVYSFERFYEAPIGAFYKQYVGAVEKMDELTVKITAPAVYDGMFSTLSTVFYVLPKDYVESIGGQLGEVAVGSGPFMVEEFVAGSHINLVRNDDYFRGAPELEKLSMKFIPDASTRTISLESNEVDFIIKPSNMDRKNLKDNSNITYSEGTSFTRYSVALSNFGLLQDEKLREAIIKAINNEEIFYAVEDGVGNLMNTSFVPEAFPEYADVSVVETFNIEEGKKALNESSYDAETDKVVITVTTPKAQKIAEIIQNQLSQIGIETQIDTIEIGVYYQRIGQGLIEIAISTGGGSIFGPQEELGGYTSMQDMAQRWPDSEQFDALYMELVKEADLDMRRAIMTEMYGIVNEMYITTPLYAGNESIAYTSGLHGVKVHPDSQYRFDEASWQK